MLIYLIRHGETDYNVARRFQGMWVESHLTENGKAQARAKRAMDRVLASDGETVAVVSHGGTIRYLLWALTGIEPTATALLPNCSFAVVEIKNGKGMLKQFGLVPDPAANATEAY